VTEVVHGFPAKDDPNQNNALDMSIDLMMCVVRLRPVAVVMVVVVVCVCVCMCVCVCVCLPACLLACPLPTSLSVCSLASMAFVQTGCDARLGLLIASRNSSSSSHPPRPPCCTPHHRRRLNESTYFYNQWQLPLLFPQREFRSYFELVSYLAPAGAAEPALWGFPPFSSGGAIGRVLGSGFPSSMSEANDRFVYVRPLLVNLLWLAAHASHFH
jgi:hypothetical protein